MIIEFLQPVDDELIEFSSLLNENQIGKRITHLLDEELYIKKGAVVIFFVPEYRGCCEDLNSNKDQIRSIRKSFYQLYLGNWKHDLIDLGDIDPGNTLSDTYYALRLVTSEILRQQAVPLILGGSQDLTYHQYRAFDGIENMINMLSIDHSFDLGDSKEVLQNHNFLSHAIVNKPYNLFNHITVGYQTYFNDINEIDLLERLFFETYRLGEVVEDMKEIEPLLRDASLVSVDCNSLMSSSVNNNKCMPNGFTAREICQIMRYVGISERIKSLGVYEINKEDNPLYNKLISQMIWYFIEGYNFQMKERIDTDNPNFTKFIVPVDKEDLVFYFSEVSGRWWIEIPYLSDQNNRLEQNTLLACSKRDYIDACNQIVPERWFRAKRKNLI